jgi:adenine-specific DNA-methyltransferase
LGGRDIKRYRQPVSDKFLIFTRRGIDIDQYPAVLNYLIQFRRQLEPRPKNFKGEQWKGRKAGTYKWYEIQDAVDYYDEFEKNKILIPAIIKYASYTYDEEGYYGNDKTSIIPTTDLHLLGLLNSSTLNFYMTKIASTKQNGYFEYKPVYVSQLPIAPNENDGIHEKAKKILKLKKENPLTDTSALEKEIDQLVYELYGLNAEEIGIIENP